MAAELSEIEGLSIGLAAYAAGRYDLATQAWEAAAGHEPAAAVNLGVLREEQADADGAAAYELAIDSGTPTRRPGRRSTSGCCGKSREIALDPRSMCYGSTDSS